MAAAGADVEVRPPAAKSSGDNVTDVLVLAHSHSAYFGVHPGFVFIDDRGAPNAYASPEAWVPEKPDGTVLLGVKLLAEVRQLQQGRTRFYNDNSFFIVLHEMAHICSSSAVWPGETTGRWNRMRISWRDGHTPATRHSRSRG